MFPLKATDVFSSLVHLGQERAASGRQIVNLTYQIIHTLMQSLRQTEKGKERRTVGYTDWETINHLGFENLLRNLVTHLPEFRHLSEQVQLSVIGSVSKHNNCDEEKALEWITYL